MPFGGSKQSGLGRENGLAALDFYSERKSVYVNLGRVEAPYYDDAEDTTPSRSSCPDLIRSHSVTSADRHGVDDGSPGDGLHDWN